ncbi:hypothetical protein DFH08DRAFT_813793 [Mycena albidolilacea]|uniref:Hydrophobin n=1 Tax=Mycena albidolilacea TaxID=1033008 RepID=A0AAD7EMD3_9AGAR|nr:hypothetical protein DFH08DRAFT_813793 [Mycena albidolilacea]
MKTTILFCALSYAISIVQATRGDSNAERFARGLPPLPPRRVSRPLGAKRSTTSSKPFQCSPKAHFCCSTLESASSSAVENILRGLGVPQNSCGEKIATSCALAPSGNSNSCSGALVLAECCGTLVAGSVGIDCTLVPPTTSSRPTATSSTHTTSSAHATTTPCDDDDDDDNHNGRGHGHRRAAPTIPAGREMAHAAA